MRKLTSAKKPEKNLPEAKSSDRLLNVSNKADVLLGAILRTSKNRKSLADISNGASKTPLSSDSDISVSSNERLAEDDRSFPSALNKRFMRFKQMFVKEGDRKELLSSEEQSNDAQEPLSTMRRATARVPQDSKVNYGFVRAKSLKINTHQEIK